MKIGELAKKTGVSQRMLRYYEQEGLLKPNRTRSGYRDYNQQSEKLVAHIRHLSEAGIKLSSIKLMLPCLSGGDEAIFVGCPLVKETLKTELIKLDQKLVELAVSRNAIATFLQTALPDSDHSETQ
ncbi:MerR family transcriptional regulator [Vibrio salinus]|uniref:MerR family transcriptional regulator n=1 Tax=Vibrio salinus TaxID=2899784 RepID=UPI001E333CE6|nr:MerR family transcriptional regulator [Vibrio salinus]MCE0495212.1 MerR family transcriptional regulator [Vibrio salinus]